MPFVQRDDTGRIVALHAEATANAREPVAAGDPDVQAFLDGAATGGPAQQMQRLDLDMARVLEDLIDLLVVRGVIAVGDFPLRAREKLTERHRLRDDLRELFGGLPGAGADFDFAGLDDGADEEDDATGDR